MSKRISENDARKLFLRNHLKPLEPFPGSQNSWRSQCLKCKQIVLPKYSSIQQGRGGCRDCGYVKLSKKRTIDQKEAVKTMVEAGLKPLEKYKSTTTKWKCLCLSCNRTIRITRQSVLSGSRCQYCSGSKVDVSLAKKQMILFGLKPKERFPGSAKKWKVECIACGNISSMTYNHLLEARVKVKSEAYGCRSCAYQNLGRSRRNSSKEVVDKFRKLGLKLLEEYKDANTPNQVLCLKCGKHSQKTYSSIRRGSGCKYCAKNYVDRDDASKEMIVRGYIPQEAYKSNHSKWLCIHKPCGNLVSPTRAQIMNNDGGCRHCADFGIRLLEPSFVYLMTNEELQAHKIGIGNLKEEKKNDRRRKHLRNGWVEFKSLNFDTGLEALEVERKVLNYLRVQRNLKVFLSADQMPQGGHTETVDANEIGLVTIWNKVVEFSNVMK